MKVRKFIGVMAVAGLGVAPQAALAQSSSTAGSTAAGSTTAKADDSTLKSRIETRLKNDAALKADDIDVDVDNGVVTLTGTVHSAGAEHPRGHPRKGPRRHHCQQQADGRQQDDAGHRQGWRQDRRGDGQGGR